ncbi:S41 family peptidase [Winogradskyella flava]|uniref:S41 family peptidase n=1 Tax=Winogradskyella flava TaxID=1884876 RepID=UPI002491E95C|nr:S41 family peptidase [Winogradskyella flava]
MKLNILIILLFWNVFSFAQNDTILKTYTKKELISDYDLAVSALKESHPGLYWYTNYSDYENIFKKNRDKIKDGMNSYEFFRILCYITAADKEGHSSVNSSKEVSNYFRHHAKFLPLGVKIFKKKLYLINDINNNNTKGKIIKSINGVAIDSVLERIFNHKSSLSDGFTTTGKFKSINRYSFAFNYHDYVHNLKTDKISMTLIDSKTNSETKLLIPLVNRDSIFSIGKTTPRKKIEQTDKLYKLEIKSKTRTAIMTFNTFSYHSYKRKNLNFKSVVDSLFYIIKKKKIKNLVIDVRNNSGGFEGAEDYLYSYLTKNKYKKYEYVETKNISYSFINNTNYKDNKDALYNILKKEHYLSNDGRYLRKGNVLPTHLPQKRPFTGNLYILISGRTYSGGSEFASIAKSQKRATFVGEETGGGFYGQTSGSYVYLLLPNSKIKIRIPLLKFSTAFKSNDIPFGRGVIPEYEVEQTYEEYTNGIDSQLEYTLNLIRSRK